MARDRSKEPEYGTPDEDTPELTAETLERARSFADVMAEHGITLDSLKGPHRVTVTTAVDIPVEIVDHFKAGGDDWEMRIRKVLKDYVDGVSRKKSA